MWSCLETCEVGLCTEQEDEDKNQLEYYLSTGKKSVEAIEKEIIFLCLLLKCEKVQTLGR